MGCYGTEWVFSVGKIYLVSSFIILNEIELSDTSRVVAPMKLILPVAFLYEQFPRTKSE